MLDFHQLTTTSPASPSRRSEPSIGARGSVVMVCDSEARGPFPAGQGVGTRRDKTLSTTESASRQIKPIQPVSLLAQISESQTDGLSISHPLIA